MSKFYFLWKKYNVCLIFEPGHSISYQITCMPSDDSNQPVYSHRLLSLCCLPEDPLGTWLPSGCPAKTDQTAPNAQADMSLFWAHKQSYRICCAGTHLTLVMLNKLRYQAHFQFSANKTAWFSFFWYKFRYWMTNSAARSVGFWRSQLVRINTFVETGYIRVQQDWG